MTESRKPVKRNGTKRSSTITDAAKRFGKHRKQVHRWRAIEGSPFDSDGACDLDELGAWLAAQGLLTRDAHRPSAADSLPDAPGTPAAPASTPAVDGETATIEELIEALIAGDKSVLMRLTGRVSKTHLQKAQAMGDARKKLAEAERTELENRIKRRELVPMDEVLHFWSRQVEVVRAYLTAMPGKLSARLVRQEYEAVYQALEDEANQIQAALAKEPLT